MTERISEPENIYARLNYGLKKPFYTCIISLYAPNEHKGETQ